MKRYAFLLTAVLAAPALACEIKPDLDNDGAPWRRAVAKVKYLPEVEVWAELMSRERAVVQYVLSLDEARYVAGQCYWPLEVRADGKLQKRFLVTPDGSDVREDRRP